MGEKRKGIKKQGQITSINLDMIQNDGEMKKNRVLATVSPTPFSSCLDSSVLLDVVKYHVHAIFFYGEYDKQYDYVE